MDKRLKRIKEVLKHWEDLYYEETIGEDRKMAVREIWKRISNQVEGVYKWKN